jgi:hypothetical protein
MDAVMPIAHWQMTRLTLQGRGSTAISLPWLTLSRGEAVPCISRGGPVRRLAVLQFVPLPAVNTLARSVACWIHPIVLPLSPLSIDKSVATA